MAAAKAPEGGVRGPSETTSACAGRDTEDDPNRWCWMLDALGVRWPSPGSSADIADAVCVCAAASKGFGCSRPSADARGVSCSSRVGHSRIMAFGMGKYDEDEGVHVDGD